MLQNLLYPESRILSLSLCEYNNISRSPVLIDDFIHARVTYYHRLAKPSGRKTDIIVYAAYSAYSALERNSDYSRYRLLFAEGCKARNATSSRTFRDRRKGKKSRYTRARIRKHIQHTHTHKCIACVS